MQKHIKMSIIGLSLYNRLYVAYIIRQVYVTYPDHKLACALYVGL